MILHPTQFFIDPFNELHINYTKSIVSLSDVGDYWIGEVNQSGVQCGSGRLVKENQVVQTCMINGAWNGLTDVFATESFQETFDSEKESGLYISGKRTGTFVKTELNGTITYTSFVNDQLFPESFDASFDSREWTIEPQFVQNCQPLIRREICSVFFDCAVKTILHGDTCFCNEFVLYNNLLKSLVLNNCSSRRLTNIIIHHCENLEKILLKDECFSLPENRGCLWIDDCPRLESLTVKESSSCVYFSNLFLSSRA